METYDVAAGNHRKNMQAQKHGFQLIPAKNVISVLEDSRQRILKANINAVNSRIVPSNHESSGAPLGL